MSLPLTRLRGGLIASLLLLVLGVAPLSLATASDLSITAASVQSGTGAVTTDGTAGASITAGQMVYLDATDNKYKLADANLSSAAAATVGVSLHAASNGQPLRIQTSGPITIGATVAVGTVYVLSGTAGGIAPAADLTTGWRTSIVGVATSTTSITLKIYASDAAVP